MPFITIISIEMGQTRNWLSIIGINPYSTRDELTCSTRLDESPILSGTSQSFAGFYGYDRNLWTIDIGRRQQRRTRIDVFERAKR